MNDFYVYFLIDLFNKIPFYVGKGRGNRAYAHLRGHANYNKDKLNYIENIRSLGDEPIIIKMFENLSNEDALKTERLFIRELKSMLTNST